MQVTVNSQNKSIQVSISREIKKYDAKKVVVLYNKCIAEDYVYHVLKYNCNRENEIYKLRMFK